MAESPSSLSLSTKELSEVIDFLEEIDAVIDADDGTLVPLPLLEKHERMKEIFQ